MMCGAAPTTGGSYDDIPVDGERSIGQRIYDGLRSFGQAVSNIFTTQSTSPPDNAYDPNGPKAPGKPSGGDGFVDPKGGDRWSPNPNGRGSGWEDRNGNVWVPTGQGGEAHGGPHWDVQRPGGGYDNVYPGGRRR
jgi:hypothetical protein